MSTLIPPTPAANKSAEQHQEPSEQDSFNHLLYKDLRLTSEQVQDLNDWMEHQGIPNVHEVIAQNFLTEVWILQGIYPLKDEWVFGCSLKTRLADQTKTQQLKWLWSKDSMNSTINQRLVEQTQEVNFELEGSGGSTLVTP